MGTLLQDLRYALRVLRGQPGFAVVALLTLAVGIGASTAIFTVVNAVVLRPLPYEEPDRLVMVFEQNLPRGWKWYTVSPANFLDWKDQSRSFEELAAYSLYSDTGFNLTGGGEPERIDTTAVGAGFFEALRARPRFGRIFEPAEDEPGKDQVVILSHGLWQRRFGGDPAILEQSVTLDGVPHRIVGIMGQDFAYPAGTDLWLPMAMDGQKRSDRTVRTLFVVGRLADGVSLEQAGSEMSTIAARLEGEYPTSNADFGAVVFTLHQHLVGDISGAMLVLLGAVGFLLLIACANVANLLLARATGRSREFALRQALGAGRRRLISQMITESLVLSLLGGVLGLALAQLGTRLLIALAPANIPRISEVSVDGRVLLVTLALSVLTGLLFSLVPSLRLARLDLIETLKAGGRSDGSGERGNARNLIVISEVAFALILLIGAGLLIRSLAELQRVDPGFEAAELTTLQLALPMSKYPSATEQALLYDRILEETEALPGVSRTAITSWLPLASIGFNWDFHVEGQPPSNLQETVVTGFRSVSPGYFETLGIPLREGRLLEDGDRAGAAPVAVINETMARQFWPAGDAIGKRVVLGQLVTDTFPNTPLTVDIVGIVGDVKQTALNLPTDPELYVPYGQYAFPTVYLAARSTGAGGAAVGAIRRQVQAIDPNQPIYDVQSMTARLSATMAQPRLTMQLLGLFAALALFLASVGIYGVIAYSVSRRTRELGLRLALGAQRSDVLRMILRQGLRLAVFGILIGLVLAAVVVRFLQGLLFGVAPSDPPTFLVVAGLLAVVALLASLLPALRATRVDPMIALRYE